MTESSRLPPVLVVEDRADRPVGHWPVLFAEVAAGFAAVGCRVAVLTSRGWYFAGERGVPFRVYEYGAPRGRSTGSRIACNAFDGRVAGGFGCAVRGRYCVSWS
jgi:hypothetical protein